ncbi:hypothetical protein HHI36_012144 [Cryptolaemus montrouzieri]|uniref:Uncharacterized protein n=1 Tax=Cryptolaemus montrouzieri TaxID=559131 RepID=A0ABD2NEJ6_9CUCU
MVTNIVSSKKAVRDETVLLKQSLIMMVKSYPQIPILKRSSVTDAFILALYSFQSSEMFESFLSDLIHQSVIWSCSHHHISELGINEENQKLITVKSYFPFWSTLLNMEFNTHYDEFEMDLKRRRQLFSHIVHELIVTLLVCVNKLDVSMSLKDINSTDIKDLFEINEKNDFAVFLNIVDFYEEILGKINPSILLKCINRLLNFFMEKSTIFPMISGFYRLLATCIRIAKKMEYFTEVKIEMDEGSKKECWLTLSFYMQMLLSRINQFKDELLISCLKVFLECPTNIIEEMLPACVPAFVIIFSIGRNYIPVADMGIRTLEIWQKNLAPETMEEFLKKIVPSLDSFLRSRSLAYLSPEYHKRNKTTKALDKRKVVVEIEPELVKLQRRILRFLGRQSALVCKEFISSHQEIVKVSGDVEHLKITLPFEDIKLNIYADQLVPKVVELALYCSDRKMRIIACELLQALVILFLGTSKQMTEKGQKELEGLFKKISLAILELGCDPDEVVRQLFEPLVLQMIHWYSSPLQSKKCHTFVIMETILNGICSSTNSNLRTFSGKCVGEFVKWTIKQSTEARLIQEPINIKILIRKMRYFSSHPDNFKKLGAALIFNNLYVFLREEKGLLSIFWMEILHIFVSSLHFVEENDGNNLIDVQISAALKHLQRGFTEKSYIFNKSDENRRIPLGFKDTRLIDVIRYLLENICVKNSVCRDKCMELFCNIIPFVTEVKSPLKYFGIYIGDPLVWLRDNFETYLNEYTSIESLECCKTSTLFEWMSELERCLDGYIFLLKNEILNGKNLEKTVTLLAVKYYVHNVAFIDIKDALNLINEQEWTLTTFEKKIYLNKQNIINDKTLRFSF